MYSIHMYCVLQSSHQKQSFPVTNVSYITHVEPSRGSICGRRRVSWSGWWLGGRIQVAMRSWKLKVN